MSHHPHLQTLVSLKLNASQSMHRCGVVLDGSREWQLELLEAFGAAVEHHRALIIGNDSLSYGESLTFKQARQKLGQESDLIVADLSSPFDANGFTAVSGTLKGGGILIVLPSSKHEGDSYSPLWLERALKSFHCIKQNVDTFSEIKQVEPLESFDRYEQQQQAIQAISRVLSGHRKRPLVITADRGRGKSAALGMAAGQIIKGETKKILVTAPNTQSVKTLFEHAKSASGCSNPKPNTASSIEGGSVEFIAPDELLREQQACDLLLVDEAAAIPLPILKSIVERYHRVCFATTVHGYEGCGRGFGIKFEAWLSEHRPGWNSVKLTQPIRWNPDDPMEAWLFDTFLLDAEIESAPQDTDLTIHLKKVAADSYARSPDILRKGFGLLVNAHYQTTPNDLFQLLDDPNIVFYQALQGEHVVGVIVGYLEGGLEESILADVQLGRRRPAGHMVPVSLVSQLADNAPARVKSLRIMRIAVHPDLQGHGIGGWMLSQLSEKQTDVEYLSTSFGVTGELANFWVSNHFQSVHLGSKQDQASGCFSVTMVKPLNHSLSWLDGARHQLREGLLDTASDIHRNLSSDVLMQLLSEGGVNPSEQQDCHLRVLENYVQGGASFEGTRSKVRELLLLNLHRIEFEKVTLISGLVIKKLSWSDVCKNHGFTGRKQAEANYREAIQEHLLSTR
ncbi:GNAT family N-acetyltransferase [Vibrio breoganii]|uniref:tRNA(Met) cytidine acetyltransferase TmcA n=1 Tax=Vibrio breoganii TaxID=553239 RepID=A0ABX1UAK6_9VIBR|nr:GNAT family N-acetyltransferase [Vibrio breoganii]NMO74928.1 tRNA(Met) cytidine acetyltransferase [Vibrio breoganii]NMR71503.1 tRNA(Met) cytidine acetyltransferase [Vibrio breoganii]PMG06779.1 GNAT family N-acetyltransferase [Vibrio breoganii]PML86618.1 GNAT family N-acetyltransferase [Vibrio breoganii]